MCYSAITSYCAELESFCVFYRIVSNYLCDFSQAGIALSICQTLATAMGPNIKQHVRTLGGGIISNFGDSKVCKIILRIFFYRF